jgi:hypothetical protein
MNNAAIKIHHQKVWADGSGVSGLYEVYGTKFQGIHDGDERITVSALNVREHGHRGARDKGVVTTGRRLVERHLQAVFSDRRNWVDYPEGFVK